MTVPGGSGCPGSWITGTCGGLGGCGGGLADTGMKREGWTKSRSVRRRIPLSRNRHQISQDTSGHRSPQKESYGRTPPSVWITGHEVPFSVPFQPQLAASVQAAKSHVTWFFPSLTLTSFADLESRNVSAEHKPEVGRLHQEITMERTKSTNLVHILAA